MTAQCGAIRFTQMGSDGPKQPTRGISIARANRLYLGIYSMLSLCWNIPGIFLE
jgi:hypothetical protein